MTMCTLPNFCRVCLKHDKNLIDLEHIENEPNETLMSKLEHCVSEVEWKVFKPLLCHPCIKRLNIAYTFKKECVQSASMLKSYLALMQDPQIKDAQNTDLPQSGAYMMLPNQKYIKIVVGPQNQNTFQNVFLNVIPAATLNSLPQENTNNNDTNQNVFFNINNTFQKFVASQDCKEMNVNELLTESKSEELSVEIDPTDFGLGECASSEEDCENGLNDWEDLISSSQIKLNGSNNEKTEEAAKSTFGSFVPILPKQDSNDDKMDFVNSGQHFLSSQLYTTDYVCETCQKQFTTKKSLRNHFKDFHLGKFPFKCNFCYNEFILRTDYEACMKYHKPQSDPLLTLNDFANNSEKITTNGAEATQQELATLECELCKRQFNSTSGLLRHKVRKHNQKNKKKYFIKGMKNAKCDICNREFSTQSYMQLHRKLHLRDDLGYKYKVLGKSRYIKTEEEPSEKNDLHKKDNSESDSEQLVDNHNAKDENIEEEEAEESDN